MKAKKGTVRYGVYQAFADYSDMDDDDPNKPIFDDELYTVRTTYPTLTAALICKMTGFNPNTVRGLIRKGLEWGMLDRVKRGHYVITEDGITYFYFMTLGAI